MSPYLIDKFVNAGWYPGRQRSVPPNLPPDHPAYAVLRSFDGLAIGSTGAGIECATSDIRFCPIEPDDEIITWNKLLGETLFGIAEFHHAHSELFIDTAGRCYGRSCVHDAFCFEGKTLFEAVERLLLGMRSRPMLRPDQVSLVLYGNTYNLESPEVYKYNNGGPPA
jgi:hypothetical protein